MANFPSTPTPSYDIDIWPEEKTYITPLQFGQEQRRQVWLFPRRHIRLEYNVISAFDMDTLWNFFREVNGRKDDFWFFWPFSDAYIGEWVGRGDDSTRLFDLPAKETVEGNLVVYVGGTEPSVLDWINNGAFDTGDFTGWTQNSSTINSTDALSTSYCSELEAIGSDINGAQSDVIIVNPAKKYEIDSWHDVDVYSDSDSTGTYKFVVQFYSDEAGSVLISESVIYSNNDITSGYEQGTKTVGPASTSPDITFPANTASIRLQQKWDGGDPSGTAFMDDISVNIIGGTDGYVMLEGGGGGESDRVYFQPGNNLPTDGSLITCDIEGELRIKCRFKNSMGFSKKLFTATLYTTGIELVEVKESN
ncbi:MAG: DUF2460 domain-containing protein [Methylococcaceae bacterium]